MLHFSLRILPGDEVKIAVPVSKKIARKAVTRNLIRRRVRAVVRDLFSGLKPGFYLISAKAGADKIRSEALKNELQTLLGKL